MAVHLVEFLLSPHDGWHTPHLLIRLDDELRSRQTTVTGTLAELVRSYLRQETPIGIVLDCLEENITDPPSEWVGVRLEIKRAALEWLRQRYPNGV